MERVQLDETTASRELLKLQKRALVAWANYLIELASLKSVIQGIRQGFLDNGVASPSAKYYLDTFDLQLLVGRVLAKELKWRIEGYLELDSCGIETPRRTDEWKYLPPVVPKEHEGTYLAALSDLTEGAVGAEEVVAALFKAQHVGIELASREDNPLDPNRLEFGVSLEYIEDIVRQKIGSVNAIAFHKALDEQIDGGSVVPRYLWQIVNDKEVWYRSFRIGEGQAMVRAHVMVECFKTLSGVKRSEFLPEVLTEKFIVLACDFCELFRDPGLVAAPGIYRGFHLYGARLEVVVAGRREWLIDWGQGRRMLTSSRARGTFGYALHPKYKNYFRSEENPLTEPMRLRLAQLARWTVAAEKGLEPDFLTCITTVESEWAYKMALMAELKGWLHDRKTGLSAAMFALDDLVEQTTPERFQKATSALSKLANWHAQAKQKYLLRKKYSDYIAKANTRWPETSYEDTATTWCQLIQPKIRKMETRGGKGIEDILQPTLRVTHCVTTLLRNILSQFSIEPNPKQRPISVCVQEVIKAIESLSLEIRSNFEPAISGMQAVTNAKDLRSAVAKVREPVQKIGDATDWVLEHLETDRSDKTREDMPPGSSSIHIDIDARKGNVFFQNTQKGGIMVKSEDVSGQSKQNDIIYKSAWANGSFYIFIFALVITGLAVLANTVPLYLLPIVLIAAVIFVPIIGGLELARNRQLSEKGFIKLMQIAIAQLPLIAEIAKKHKNDTTSSSGEGEATRLTRTEGRKRTGTVIKTRYIHLFQLYQVVPAGSLRRRVGCATCLHSRNHSIKEIGRVLKKQREQGI